MTVPFPTAMRDLPRVRQSLLGKFDACGLTTKFSLEHEQGWSTPRAAGGTILHRAIARCLEVIEENGETAIPVELAMTIYDEIIRQADVPLDDGDGLGDSDIPVPTKEIVDMRVALRTWAAYSPPWNIDEFAGIEKRYDITLSYPDGHGGQVDRIFTTKPDLITIDATGEHATVWDWKSSWSLPPERSDEDKDDELDEGGYFQQRAAALVAFRTYPRLQSVTTREVYPRWMSGKGVDRAGKPIRPYRDATLYRHLLPELEAEFSALIERFDRAYEHNVWKPMPGGICQWCANPGACTIFPQARREGAITSPEEAERVAGRMSAMAGLQKKNSAALKAWSQAHGDVPIRDEKRPKVYGPVVRQRTTKPTAAQVREAMAAGQDPTDLYVTKDVAVFAAHAPDEVHPHVQAVREQEQHLLEEQRDEIAEREAVSR